MQLIENYGQLKIVDDNKNVTLPGGYIKVYAKYKDSRINFYKEGYSDPRGRFDYISISMDDLDRVEKLSILILSDDNGAVVYEAAPPKR